MNIGPPREFSRLAHPVQDLRPHYQAEITHLVRTCWNRRHLIVAAVIGTVALSLAGARLMGRTYVGEALVQLKLGGDPTGPSGAGNVTVDGAAVVEGEAEIIRSRTIAKRVLERLDAQAATPETATHVSTLQSWLSFGQAEPTGSDAAFALDQRLAALQKKLTVKNDSKTYLIDIVYAAGSPARAATVANAFADEYLKSRVGLSFEAARRTRDWLSAQVAQGVADRQKAETNLRDFRTRADVIAADAGDPRVRDQQIRDVVGQISAAHLDRLQLEARLQRLAEAAATGQMPPVQDFQGSADAQRLIEAEISARQEVARLAGTLGLRHPLYTRAEKGLEDARQQLTEVIASASGITRMGLASARQSEDSLTAQLQALKSSSSEGPLVGDTLKDLEAEKTTAQANLDRLREAYRQALALTDLKPVAAQIVSVAEPITIPASPNLGLVAILAIVAGLAGGLLWVFLLELRDVGYLTGAQVAADLDIPCTGTIPATGFDSPADQFVQSQALKSLAIRSGLAEPRKDCAVVVVTSTMRGEGKSDLVRGLAATLGALGRRVLIVENTARSSPDDTADERDDPGIDAADHPVPGERAGPAVALQHRMAGNLSTAFKGGDGLQPWIEQARRQFDLVLLEAPGIMTDAETLMIVRAADMVLFAVRWRSTPRQAVMAAFGLMAPVPGQRTMAVVTEVDLHAHSKLGTRDSLYFSNRYASAARP